MLFAAACLAIIIYHLNAFFVNFTFVVQYSTLLSSLLIKTPLIRCMARRLSIPPGDGIKNSITNAPTGKVNAFVSTELLSFVVVRPTEFESATFGVGVQRLSLIHI